MVLELQEAVRKPFPVKIVQVTLQNIEEVAAWCKGTIEQRPTRMLGTTTDLPVIILDGRSSSTPHPRIFEAALGCWIVELHGSFRSYKPLQFESSFDILPSPSLVEATDNLEQENAKMLADSVSANGVPNAEVPVYEAD